MEQSRIDAFMIAHSKEFPADKIGLIRSQLSAMDDRSITAIEAIDFKDPTTILIISILVGGLGIDRFMIGKIGTGVLKLLTGGVLGIMTIYDWFTIRKQTREYNFQQFTEATKNIF